jgi:hypothetical protein
MSAESIDRIRSIMHVSWDTARERRVLATTIERCEQRARRRRMAVWIAAAAVVLFVLRALPRFGSATDDSGGFAGARPASSGTGGNAGTG